MRAPLGWRRAAPPVLVAATLTVAGCSGGGGPAPGSSISGPASTAAAASTEAPTETSTETSTSSSTETSTPASPARSARARSATATAPDVAGTDPTVLAAAAGGALRGKVIVIDPGHNGANGRYARQIARQVFVGNGRKACDTTGTETNAGYPESAFTFDVATRLAAVLRSEGATVVLTRPDNRGVGPCITERAAIGNRAHADVALSIHADGAPSAGHGFHIIVPRGIGRNDAIVTPSRGLGVAVRDAFRRGTGEPLSTYTGTRTGGLVARSDLGGLNLSAVPKVFIECGNMRNATDARRMTSPAWRQRAAVALATGLTAYLTRSG